MLDHVIVLGERQLKRLLTAYFAYYNHVRPHSALGYRTPAEFGATAPRADCAAPARGAIRND
jgi:transposase InsO family protein